MCSSDLIYIAIRRGPMKTPTSGTSVFTPVAWTGTGANATVTAGFPVSSVISFARSAPDTWTIDRLRGSGPTSAKTLRLWSTDAELSGPYGLWLTDSSVGINLDSSSDYNFSGRGYGIWNFQRAPGFFDEVCYTGTGSATTQMHNLGVVPELMIVKNRSSANQWYVYAASLGADKALYLNSDISTVTSTALWNNTSPTSSVFSIGAHIGTNGSGDTYVAYLFASCPGVSKVGSYSGTGATQTINCGFTGGARFVLIKRTDSTGGWYAWDTARGMISGTDPYILLNTNTAEVNANNVYTTGVGFQIVGTGAGINASGGTYIYLAIA